jgi:pimeloyl-ACP methyl ester carboxylesterase
MREPWRPQRIGADGIDLPPVVVGHSLGALIAVMYAVRHPADVADWL